MLHVTDPAAPPSRATLDVDAIVRVTGTVEYGATIAPAMRALGAREDDSDGAPLCRWILDGITVDLMPTAPHVLGFTNRGYESAHDHAEKRHLPDGTALRIADAAHFVATKIEAFAGRGGGDFASSKDLEDVVAVVDGREELAGEIPAAPHDVRVFVARTFGDWLLVEAFRDALAGHLPGDADSQGRVRVVVARLRAIAALR
jgi:predicted nucleotidyltransferase